MLCLFAHVEGSTTEQVAACHRAGDAGFHRNMAVAVDASFTMSVLLRRRPTRPALDTVGTKAEETGDCRKGEQNTPLQWLLTHLSCVSLRLLWQPLNAETIRNTAVQNSLCSSLCCVSGKYVQNRSQRWGRDRLHLTTVIFKPCITGDL